MPAFIAHMIIADRALALLAEEPEAKVPDSDLARLLRSLEKKDRQAYMHLGSAGPDLPYYASLRSVVGALVVGPRKPTGVDDWSYQLHSRHPNLFPLKMAEIIWKESNPRTKAADPWEEEDEKKIAFLCGYLTHVAADQVIHPAVNRVAGPYNKDGCARRRHATCEVHQDLYLLSQRLRQGGGGGERFTLADLKTQRIAEWSNLAEGAGWQRLFPVGLVLSLLASPVEDLLEQIFWPWDWQFNFFGTSMPDTLQYLLQKSFVEAHAVRPSHRAIRWWTKGYWLIQRLCHRLGPYRAAYRNLFVDGRLNTETLEYKDFIGLQEYDALCGYDAFVTAAVGLARDYILALVRLHARDIDDPARVTFLATVKDADLGSPLEPVAKVLPAAG